MYSGTTVNGIKQELQSLRRSLDICSKRQLKPLAISAKLGVLLRAEWLGGGSGLPNAYQLLSKHELSGALKDFLTDMVFEKHWEGGEVRTDEPTPDSWESPLNAPIMEPLSNVDYACQLCHRELWNYYYQCKGCWELLKQDFHICWTCYRAGKHLEFLDPGEILNETPKSSNEGHIGRKLTDHEDENNTCKKCPKKRKCVRCNECSHHRCLCHNDWKLRYRFYTPGDIDDIHAKCCLLSASPPITTNP